MFLKVSVLVLAVAVCVFGNAVPSLPPCKPEDSDCITKSAQNAIQQIIAGVPDYGIESSEPLFIDLIQADVANLKYNFTDVTVKGYRDCEISNIALHLKKSSLHFDLTCKFEMSGDYIMNGRLLILPIDGKGKFSILAHKMLLNIDAEVKEIQGSDGREHLNIKKFNFDVAALDKVVFEFKNLFNGNKELSDGVHTFANENYKEVTKELSSPIFNAGLKKILKSVNKYLKKVPIEELIL